MDSLRLELRVSEEWLAALDRGRGQVPRGTWVKRVVEKALVGVGSGQASERDTTGDASLPRTPAPSRPSVPISAALERQARLNKAKGL